MKKLYDVLLPRKNSKGEFVKRNGKSVYRNYGAIVENDKGYKSLVLETMHGEVWFSLFESKPKEEKPVEPAGDIDNDYVPF